MLGDAHTLVEKLCTVATVELAASIHTWSARPPSTACTSAPSLGMAHLAAALNTAVGVFGIDPLAAPGPGAGCVVNHI
jgi:hypothetical protein